MADPTLSNGVGLQASMDIRPDVYGRLPGFGAAALAPGRADDEFVRQEALDRIAGLGGAAIPRIMPPPEQAARVSPDLYFNPTTDRFAVGGLEFGREEYDRALASRELAGRPQPVPTGPGWQRMSPVEYQSYLDTVAQPRGILGSLGVGLQNVGEGLLGGTGRGLQMLGAESLGGALVGAGEVVGMSPAQRARSAAIAEQQGLLGQVGTAVVESVPSLGASVGAGILGAKAGAAVGALGGPAGAALGAVVGGVAGSVAALFPMELQSSWEAAEAAKLDTSSPEVQTDILNATLFKTAAQTAGQAVLVRGFSPALQAIVGETAKRTLGSRLARGVGAGAMEGSAEALAQVTDRVMFDPALRTELNEADFAALVPLIVERYGRETAVAFLAGGVLGGAAGAMGADTRPALDINTNKAVNVLSGTKVEPQAPKIEPAGLRGAPDAFAGLRPEAAEEEMLARAWTLEAGAATPRLSPEDAALAAAWEQSVRQQPRLSPEDAALAAAWEQSVRLQPTPAPAPTPAAGLRPEVAEGEMLAQAWRAATPRLSPEDAALAAAWEQSVQPQAPLVAGAPTPLPMPVPTPSAGLQIAGPRPEAAEAATLARAWQQSVRPPVQPAGFTGPQAEMFTPQAMGIARAAQARMAPSDRDVASQIRAMFPDEVEIAPPPVDGQGAFQFQFTDPTATPGVSPFAGLAGLAGLQRELQARAAVQQDQPRRETDRLARQAAERAAREADFERALAQRGRQAAARADEDVAARTEAASVWSEIAANANSKISFEVLTDAAQNQWIDAVQAGVPRGQVEATTKATRLRTLFNKLKGKTVPAKVRAAARAAGETPQRVEAAKAEIAARLPPNVLGDAKGRPFKSALAAGGARVKTAQRENIAVERLSVEEVPGGWGLRVAPEPTPTPPKPRGAKGEALKKGAGRAVQEQGAAPGAVRKGPSASAPVREGDTEGQETARATAPEAPKAEDVAPVDRTERTSADEMANLDAAIIEVETATNDKAFVENLVDVIGWSKDGTKAVKERAEAFIAALAEDPRTSTQLRSAQGLYEARRKDPTAKLQDVLGASADTRTLVDTIEALNTGVLRGVTPKQRGELLSAWKRVRDTNPMYGNEPLANFINQDKPEFFNFGPRGANDIRPVVSKDTGRTKLSSMNVVTAPMPRGEAELVAKAFLSKLAVAPKTKLVRNVDDLRTRMPAVFAAADAARPQGDFATVAAQAAGYAYGDGNVVIFTDNIIDAAHLRAVLAHETLGHFGMRSLVPPKQFNALMDKIYQESEVVRSEVDAATASRPMSRAEAVEEYLADYAAVLDTSLIAKIWSTLKTALNKVGLRFGDEAARYLVTQARRYVRNGQQSHVFDNAAVARRLHDIEMGQDPDGTGRFAPGRTLSELGMLTGVLDGSSALMSREGLISRWDSVKDLMGRIKAAGFDLTNYRAKQNPGYEKFYRTIMQANRLAMSYKTKAGEAMARYLTPSVTVAGVRIGDGVTDDQRARIDQMLYAAQRYAVATAKVRPDAKRAPLVEIVNGTVRVNDARLKELREMGRRTLDQFRTGFSYTVYDDVVMTDAQRQKLVADRDAAIAAATTDEQRKKIKKDFDARIAGGTILQARTESFPAMPELTKDSPEWVEYTKARDMVEFIELELVKAHQEAYLKTLDNQLLEIAEAAGGTMTAEDRGFMLKLNDRYNALFNTNRTVTDEGQIIHDADAMTNANEFIAAVNAALIATRGKDRNPAALEFFPDADRAGVEAGIERFKARFAPKDEAQKFVVQNKIKEMVTADISRLDNTFYAERTIGTGYLPIQRKGRYQARIGAVDPKTGTPLKIKDTFQQQLSYHQVETIGEANLLRDRIADVLGDVEQQLPVWDATTRRYEVRSVKLAVYAEKALDVTSAPPEVNLNEFVLALRRFSINLDPDKMKDVVTALTAQNSRARNRLQRAFVPGASTDAARAVSAHVESRASTIAKTLMRPDLDRLMNLNLDESRRLWNANDPEKLARLEARVKATQADPNATEGARMEARRALDRYRYQNQQVTRKGVGMANQYYGEAARALAFLDAQKNLDESDFASGEIASTIRSTTSIVQLGGSPATAALTPISLATNTLPYLASYNSANAFGGGFGMGPAVAALNKALRQVGAPGTIDEEKNTSAYYYRLAQDKAAAERAGLTQDEAQFLGRQIETGVGQAAQSNALAGTARGRMSLPAAQQFVDKWMLFFNRTEQAARRATLLAAYRLQYDRSIQAGADAEAASRAADEFAVRTVEDTLGEYAMMNRPALWRGGVAQFAYMYKVFPTMSIHLIGNLPRTAQLITLGGLMALTGLSGLPFAEDIEDLVDTIAARLGLAVPSVRLEIAKALDEVMPGMSPFVLKGFANALFAGDVAGRTSLDFFPGTSMFLPGADVGRELLQIAGPAAGMLQASLTSATAAAQWVGYSTGLTARPASLETVFREAPVTMVRAWADAVAYTQSGAIVDRRGYAVTEDMSTMDTVVRALGFYPSAAAEQYGIVRVSQRISNMQRDLSATFYNAFVQARLRGDNATADRVAREVDAWNRDARGTGLEINNFMANALRRLKEAQRSSLERTIKAAPTASREQYEGAADLLGY